jgi:hypothetical protein
MDVTIAVVVISALIVGLFCTSLILGGILLLSKNTTLLPELLSRVAMTEEITRELLNDVRAETSEPEEIWRTSDGKYTAGSFEELLSKMASDPDGPLTQEEINAIKSVFNKIAQDDTNNDDEPKEPWKS